jgi:hypothetical protein
VLSAIRETLKTAENRLDASLQEKLQGFSKRHRRPLLAFFAVCFVVGCALSIWAAELRLSDIDLLPLAVVLLIGTPLTIVLNAWGLKLLAGLAKVDFSLPHAVSVTVAGTLASMLPVPGGMMVRAVAMVHKGATLRASGTNVLLGYVLWLGLAGTMSGLALLRYAALPGAVMAVSCGLLLGLALWRVAVTGGLAVLALLTAQRALMLGVSVLRFWLTFAAMGAAVSLVDSSVFAVSSVFGAIVGIVPSGLAVSEGVAALLASMTAVSPAAAFLVIAINRIFNISISAAAFLVLHWRTLLLRGERESET